MALELYRRKQQESQEAKDLEQDGKSLYKKQTKILASNVAGGSQATGLTFNNLEIGKTYRVSGQVQLECPAVSGSTTPRIEIRQGSAVVGRLQGSSVTVSGQETAREYTLGVNFTFECTNTSLTFFNSSGNSNPIIVGNGTLSTTYIQLEEVPNMQITTQWT